ncbi:glutamyl-tRNA reductase [Sediminibacterium soli]|uniref:glutamyl-tRNA reductase n=1 Tax=Sediminibacterium soli TaxID=2698829 RepID=UPI00137ABEF1|nr:glutamyl-tRNA reductase [Sediminibacterium soli]NCI47331.1 glutamyl-tRNA reductase [Sediminibacterium soli]
MELEHFFIVGLNYKKTDVAIRGQFAVGQQQYTDILTGAAASGISELFVVSTCNRTEIYGLAPDADALIDLLCRGTVGDKTVFTDRCYIKQGMEAVQHLFAVGAGLDSQILGDYEIVGQLKQSVNLARQYGRVGAFLERLFNTVLQSSKRIKTETALSGGTISVSFAAIQFLKEELLGDDSDKKILLLGTGKIGRNTCKNLVDYLGSNQITLINRTDEKATALAFELGLLTTSYAYLQQELDAADIIIVATNAEKPIITEKELTGSSKKILIDLSIPNNIAPEAGLLPHIKLVNVDDLSKINDATLQKRQAEVPKAEAIIAAHQQEFITWLQQRTHVGVLKAVKKKLNEMHSCDLFLSSYPAFSGPIDTAAIQKVVNNVALKMRQQHQPGCYYIEAINDFMTAS